jgi:hypothetical protein
MDDIKMDKSFYFVLVPSPKKVSNKQQFRVKLEFLYVEACNIFFNLNIISAIYTYFTHLFSTQFFSTPNLPS